jgi:hypothetical protein
MKKEFICVNPKNKNSKFIFDNLMMKLHSCKVNFRKNDKICVSSISGNYDFWIDEFNDSDWDMIK